MACLPMKTYVLMFWQWIHTFLDKRELIITQTENDRQAPAQKVAPISSNLLPLNLRLPAQVNLSTNTNYFNLQLKKPVLSINRL